MSRLPAISAAGIEATGSTEGEAMKPIRYIGRILRHTFIGPAYMCDGCGKVVWLKPLIMHYKPTHPAETKEKFGHKYIVSWKSETCGRFVELID